ncbi:hypothetical protein [Synechococcus sp. RS9916]|uniref:hypothetical protein n=1 Tax=Synechococcus sp. RS9916 TaxID=221359 RepID=UPI0000E53C8B|nr:hypothetical protein [Synechococcus sp. RS9916]EAU73270.1 hypothetical protein RS9916_27204 [Synechococcus sp. RS9916]
MPDDGTPRSGVIARLTLSALDRASQDPSCWKDPIVHRALLVSGLSVLTAALGVLTNDLEQS